MRAFCLAAVLAWGAVPWDDARAAVREAYAAAVGAAAQAVVALATQRLEANSVIRVVG
jgi:hypothetical protein